MNENEDLVDTYEDTPKVIDRYPNNINEVREFVERFILSEENPSASEMAALGEFLADNFVTEKIEAGFGHESDFKKTISYLAEYLSKNQPNQYIINLLNELKRYYDEKKDRYQARMETQNLGFHDLAGILTTDFKGKYERLLAYNLTSGLSKETIQIIIDSKNKLSQFIGILPSYEGVVTDIDLELRRLVEEDTDPVIDLIVRKILRHYESGRLEHLDFEERLKYYTSLLEKSLEYKGYIEISVITLEKLKRTVALNLKFLESIKVCESTEHVDDDILKSLLNLCELDKKSLGRFISLFEDRLWAFKILNYMPSTRDAEEQTGGETIQSEPAIDREEIIKSCLKRLEYGENAFCVPLNMQNILVMAGVIDSLFPFGDTIRTENDLGFSELESGYKVEILDAITRKDLYFDMRRSVPKYMKRYIDGIKQNSSFDPIDRNRVLSLGLPLDTKIEIILTYIKDVFGRRDISVNKTGANQFEVVIGDTLNGVDGEIVFYYTLGDNLNLPSFVKVDSEEKPFSILPVVYFRTNQHKIILDEGWTLSIIRVMSMSKRRK